MPTDTSERGLERLICMALAGHPCALSGRGGVVGSITYPASILVDQTISRITANVIERFGAA